MDVRDLSDAEYAAYCAGRDEARADEWRSDADQQERKTGRPGQARRYQREYERKAAAHWRRLAALREGKQGAMTESG